MKHPKIEIKLGPSIVALTPRIPTMIKSGMPPIEILKERTADFLQDIITDEKVNYIKGDLRRLIRGIIDVLLRKDVKGYTRIRNGSCTLERTYKVLIEDGFLVRYSIVSNHLQVDIDASSPTYNSLARYLFYNHGILEENLVMESSISTVISGHFAIHVGDGKENIIVKYNNEHNCWELDI